ncbi:hypothetical protein, partial [Pseudomonas syringae]|uniref:hypothetical protein n=1 Tax=Pseudomonas syringae TaxID=317 RepID=UPI001E612E9A
RQRQQPLASVGQATGRNPLNGLCRSVRGSCREPTDAEQEKDRNDRHLVQPKLNAIGETK